ncbi:hypothetical protein [Kaistia terrae]|uniref:Uncharacterized protein n=1 Tax=Kaistia terrae TaxID=537017 RepID=A0ABW0PYH1_9HYPH|nr:hypothetical protein [Kaistia terrae]MCX5579442.1 hypothetical protein [Kaistia terrae]
MSSVAIPQLQLKRTSQKKGPAETAISPSHGPRALGEQTMNERDASTTPPEMANRAPIFALENPAIEMERYASILAHLSEDLLSRERWEEGLIDGDVLLRTRDSTIEDVEFLVGQIYFVARQIGDATTRALNDHIIREEQGAVAGGKAINQLIARLKGNETPMQLVQAATDLARGVAA